jgi:glycosyltransferase involved in cell wall biosynthesis
MSKLPIVIAGTNGLGGVTTWAAQLRSLLADHPRYVVRLVYIGPERHPGDFDFIVPTVGDAEQLIRKLAPAILIPNYVWELFLTGFESGVKCIGMCHADDDEQYYRPLGWYEPLATKFIAVSRECAERLSGRIPLRTQDITTLPYGIQVPKSLTRNYQTDPLRLIYAGRVTQLQKRVWDFVPLVENLLKTGIPFEFDIVGEGDEYMRLRDAMYALYPPGQVRFHPRMPHHEMPRVWLGHDVFLQVSDFEGTSVSMLEAMAHGVAPVVTAASSGIAGVIHHQTNGFVVPIGDMAAMARAVAQLAREPGQLARTGAAAHESAQPYAMELYRDRFVAFLDEVVQAKDGVDLYQRYGMFGYAHPLFQQRKTILAQREDIKQLKRGVLKRFFDGGYQHMLPTKMRRYLPGPRGEQLSKSA